MSALSKSMTTGLFLAVLGVCGAARTETLPTPCTRNEGAVQQVASGERSTASAAWWGFNTRDVTEALQAALDSKARTLIIPYMGEAWIVRPLRIHGDQTILFEPGVLVMAKKGEFQGGGDSLFSASEADNLVLRGYGAVLRMRKKDYQNPPYKPAEWRMGVALRGCRNVTIEGLRIESSGGDGIYIDSGGKRAWCENITVRDVTCWDNHRQGISVISAQNLLVENCSLSGTGGTPPESGIDFEPDSPSQRMVNCVVRNCLFENNRGNAAAVYMKPLAKESADVSILFEDCVMRMGRPGEGAKAVRGAKRGGWGGMAVGTSKDDGPKGLVEFRNCTTENTGREGARVYDKSANGVRVRFAHCNWKNAWLDDPSDYKGPRSPVSITLRRPNLTTHLGGVEFVDCHVYDTVDRPALVVHMEKEDHGVRDLSGTVWVHNPHGARAALGSHAENVAPELVRLAE
jgi:hypothetical protein